MEQFRKALIEVINNSELPFDARYYVIKDVYRDMFELYEKMLEEQEVAIAQQMAEAKAKEEEIANKNVAEKAFLAEEVE